MQCRVPNKEQNLELENGSPDTFKTQRRMGDRTARDTLPSPNHKFHGADTAADLPR